MLVLWAVGFRLVTGWRGVWFAWEVCPSGLYCLPGRAPAPPEQRLMENKRRIWQPVARPCPGLAAQLLGVGSQSVGAGLGELVTAVKPVQFWFQAQLPIGAMSVALRCCCLLFPTSHQANTSLWIMLSTAWSWSSWETRFNFQWQNNTCSRYQPGWLEANVSGSVCPFSRGIFESTVLGIYQAS